VQKNCSKAVYWWEKAADQGDADAKQQLSSSQFCNKP
jgi:TPR repeat protein